MRESPAGHEAVLEIIVSDDMTVRFDELGEVHPVYATYWMAKHIEEASRKIILPFLEAHEDGIGVAVSVRHLAPAPVGTRLRVVARHERTEPRGPGSRVHALCEVGDGSGRLIGRGSTEQAVLPRSEIKARFASSNPS